MEQSQSYQGIFFFLPSPPAALPLLELILFKIAEPSTLLRVPSSAPGAETWSRNFRLTHVPESRRIEDSEIGGSIEDLGNEEGDKIVPLMNAGQACRCNRPVGR